MTKKRIIIFSLVILIFLTVGGYALAQPAGTEATLLVIDGDVHVIQSQNFFLFKNNRQANLTTGDILVVRQGDTIEVAAVSSAVLTLGDGTSADLLSDTVVQVAELFADDANFRVHLSLLSGKVISRVQRLLTANDAYKVQTPSSTASVRGTVFMVDVHSQQETFYSVNEGSVAVQMGEQEVLVEAGFEVTAVIGQPLEIQTPSLDTNAAFSERETEATLTSDSVDEAVPFADGNVADNHTDSTSTNSDQDSTQNDEKVRDELTETAVPDNGSNSVPETTSMPVSTTTGTDSPNSPKQPTATLIVPQPTSSQPTATAETILPTATDVPSPVVVPTAVVPTAVVPTAVPPTAVPPTAVPPTAVPPTAVPPTAVPPPTDEPKVTLCHKGKNTITVAQSSVQAHLDHGDSLGPCP